MDANEQYQLIKNWHVKASQEDYFARYTFEYLAFIAFLRTQWLKEGEIASRKGTVGKLTDRDYIQALKADANGNVFWYWLMVIREPENQEWRETIRELKIILDAQPLMVSNRWWNFSGFDINTKVSTTDQSGILRNEEDLTNLVEFWCTIRNNLFHADKDPESERDQKLVKFAFKTLSSFVEKVLIASRESNKIFPAMWDDFFERFLDGKAEIVTEIKRGGAAVVYDLVFLEDAYFPLMLQDRQLSKEYLVQEVNRRIAIANEINASALISSIENAARTPEQKVLMEEYFGENMKAIKELFLS